MEGKRGRGRHRTCDGRDFGLCLCTFLRRESSDWHEPRGVVRQFGQTPLETALQPRRSRDLQTGSIFKMVQGLIAMQQGVISPRTHIVCNRDIIGCHGAHTQDDLRRAVVHSCNPYFYETMRRMVNQRPELDKFDNARLGLGWWTERIKDFGLGTNLGGHVPGTRSGLVPDTTYYDNIYGKRHWTFKTIYSISIGEGELLATPLHMANLAAIMANKGYYYEPHLVGTSAARANPRICKSATTLV